MLDSARLFVLSALYYFGFTYAAFTALQQRVTSQEVAEPSVLSPAGEGPHRRSKIVIGIPALKLMVMLTSMALLSFLGAECLPLFAEMRVIFMYTLLFSPTFTQQEIYGQVFAPLLVRGGSFALSLQTSNFLSRKVPLFVVRRCVHLGIAAMNHVQRSHALDEDAVRDIVSGLVFSQRALKQVEELSRETDGATYAALARESNFAVGVFTSHVKRALLTEAGDEDDNREAREEGRRGGPVPTGRVVQEEESSPLWSNTVPLARAATASPVLGGQRSDGLVDSARRDRDTRSLGSDSDRQSEGGRRDKRKKHKIFGLF